MSIQGWYYLHINGSLIYKRDLLGTAADIRESSFARGLWRFDSSDREICWRILVEALAAGADQGRVEELAAHWGCDDIDAAVYADRLGVNLGMDGASWCATGPRFVDLQKSPAGFGDTALQAMAKLCAELGYTPQKMWGSSFSDLLQTAP